MTKVTPADQRALTCDEESWKATAEDCDFKSKSSKEDDLTRTSDSRQSKTKRVKNYFKKCKNALSTRSVSLDSSSVSEPQGSSLSSSWYVDPRLEDIVQESKVSEVEDVEFEDALESLETSSRSKIKFEVANIIEVKNVSAFREDSIPKSSQPKNNRQNSGITEDVEPKKCDKNETVEDKETGNEKKSEIEVKKSCNSTTSPFLQDMQEEVEVKCIEDYLESNLNGQEPECSNVSVKSDVESLVDKYFGKVYANYDDSKKCLIRQARDLLVCDYHGSLTKFEQEFCAQAARLLQHLKDEFSSDTSTPSGWPLCLGKSGVVVHLGPLDSSILRNRDCYICVRSTTLPVLEVSLIWRLNHKTSSCTLAKFRNPLHSLDDIMCSSVRSPAELDTLSAYDDVDGLPQMLQNLLVSVEHAIKRVPLDDLTFPCPQCLQYVPTDRKEDEVIACACQCACRVSDGPVTKKDSSIQTSPMFEFVGSIPHIDSDEEDDKESIKSGTSNKKMEISRPKSISELHDKLLMSGINLPGTSDTQGRPIILCYAECISRTALNKYEIAKLLLYYSSIPTPKCAEKGFTILLLAENEADYKILEILDKAVHLIGNCLKVYRFLIWSPGIKTEREIRTTASRIETIFINEESTLEKYITRDQAPASCGGTCTHDQLEWVEFFKQLEPFVYDCKTAGKHLLFTLSHLRNEEVPQQITRRFLNHQCRQIAKALDSDKLQKLKREGNKTLTSLAERSQWLGSSKDVKKAVSFAYDSFNAVERVTKRMEQLKQERVERLKELAKFRTLQDECEEFLNWTKKVGEETLNSLTLLLRSAGDAAGVKVVANNFDEFFFNAWKQIEKATDLIEECKNITDTKGRLKDVSVNVALQMKTFKEKLEDTRERIEDSSRCFLLLESCHDILEDDNKELESFVKLAEKSRNEKLLQICNAVCKKDSDHTDRIIQPPDKDTGHPSSEEISASSTPKSQNTQIRRRSVSSLAYIYHCNHHAAGEMCNCCESDTENTVSYKLKKKYIQTLQNCACQGSRDFLERKNSGTLRGIKEERESVENLLEKIDQEAKCSRCAKGLNCNRCEKGVDCNQCAKGSDCNRCDKAQNCSRCAQGLDCNRCDKGQDWSRCDSGLSTAENSVGDESVVYKKKLQRTCSCQYYREGCALCSAGSSSAESNQDHNDNQQDSIIEEGSDGFNKSNSSDDIDEDHYSEERRKVPPISANNHLYCHASTFDLPSDALYNNMDPKTQKTLKYIINEMIETERDYVKSLDYIIVNYIPELQREDIPQALRGQRNTVFGNVEKIYEFHSQHFLQELEECENNPLQVGQIFLKYNQRFYLYALYNKNKPKSDSLMSEYGSKFFSNKQRELGDKMDLASYLLKPVQRMGKYALLLQQLMKACPTNLIGPSERGVLQENEDLKQAEEMVRFQLRHGNDLLAMDSIRECDVNLKEQGRLIRQNEFLVWEGRSGKKSLRQVFLFEDLILFSKARRFPDRKNLDLYIYKNSIKTSDIGLTARIGDSSTKFEIWFRKRKPNDTFTLQSMSEEVKRAWTEELSQLLWKQAIKNRAVRMAEMSSMGIGNKPCLDIRPSADQISDRSISFAQLSKTAPRFRNSIASSSDESCRNVKRPHSVISMSSVSSGSTSSGGSGLVPTSSGQASLTFESSCDSPKPYHRSATLNSQCSVESGIIADMSVGSDECSSEQTQTPNS